MRWWGSGLGGWRRWVSGWMGRGGRGEEGMIMVWEGIVIVVVRFKILDMVVALYLDFTVEGTDG